MDRSEILEALSVLHDLALSVADTNASAYLVDDDVLMSLDTLDNAYNYDHSTPWWEQV